jgi:hypothetical protein
LSCRTSSSSSCESMCVPAGHDEGSGVLIKAAGTTSAAAPGVKHVGIATPIGKTLDQGGGVGVHVVRACTRRRRSKYRE